jgi:hypothetical protein
MRRIPIFINISAIHFNNIVYTKVYTYKYIIYIIFYILYTIGYNIFLDSLI